MIPQLFVASSSFRAFRIGRISAKRQPIHRFTPSNPSGEAMRLAPLIPLLIAAAAIAQQPPNRSPNDLVRKVVANELEADNQDHSHWMYQVVTNMPSPSKIQTIVETKIGNINYLEGINGHPLTPQQRTNEDQRVQQFIADPDEQRKARRSGDEDDKKSAQMFAMLPDAFIFQYAQTTGDTVKLTFHPNPDFTSHSSEAYVFHKMDGFVIVNTKEGRLVEISGVLTHGVEFAGGLLGHLDPGGTFDVRREEIAPGYWTITKLKVNMHGKALFFKTIGVQQDELHSHFQRVPDSTTLPQAEALAQKQTAASPAAE
jgi:hypothetical protein